MVVQVIRSDAIRLYCKDCIGEGSPRECDVKTCPLYRYRMGREDRTVPQKGRIPRGSAIKKFCVECVCGANGKAVANLCVSPGCVLYQYRL